jgi:hypothetical protein
MTGYRRFLRTLRPHVSMRVPRAAIAVVAIAMFSACAGASAGTPSPSTDPQAAALAFAQCMRAHGVNVPDPGSSGGGAVKIQISSGGAGGATGPDAATRAALSACQKYLPKIGGNGGGTPDPARQAQLLQFAQCMRAHGVNIPDPSSGSGGIAIGGPGSGQDINPNSATFQNAQKACQKYLPGKGAGLKTQGGGSGSGPVTSGVSAG